jgi:ATP adenylyltransferase
MTQDQLWAPWRLNYIVTAKEERPTECFLCRYASESKDDTNYVVHRGQHSLVVLNRYPYNNGHLLVAPIEHKGSLSELNDAEMLEMQQFLRRMTEALKSTINPDGFNVGLNLGKVAGAGLPGHLHWHIVPRWSGDTNFMTVCNDVSIIPQSLDALYGFLKQELAVREPKV